MHSLKLSQRGFTLIEILIALTLSIIIILAMLRAFVTTGKVTAEASLGAQSDSSMMLGLIATDRILQGIGFGDTSSYGTNLKAYKLEENGSDTYNVTATSTDNAEYLVWKIATNKCQALRNASNGLLLYGKGTGYDCTNLSKPDVENDTVERLIQINDAVQNIQFESSKATDKKIGAMTIRVIQNNCWPFGIVNDDDLDPGKYQVIITTNTYAASTESAAHRIENTTCLFNFK
ncbi:prepilin-type N-terminal cleavage/methylation domain-containing protein [Acinetobacter indicus]|uniref:prepilin-type N-terminal cleavage/methylation domain-containing protein n=1 Tax=Acinetobacter indicus TaxID=756892 RepID=UPI0025774775|nr:prepilin-type N-terminal cleavage/methylation domain-containing protein [Acinetobacter indicus]MDM1287094.1 prepilin-type N-terminal cleavage/methylation domain-containing protein [Acinetobacter indicus]